MFEIPKICQVKEVWMRAATFNEDFVNSIINIGRAAKQVEGQEIKAYGGRKGNIAWINDQEMMQKIANVVATTNAAYFHYDLTAFFDAFQYAEYGEGDFFDWHIDRAGSPEHAPRKLSFTVNLSDSSEYEGGQFEVMYAPKPEVIDLARGEMIIFDAMMCHRITLVTRGARKSLVGWACGPELR